MSNGIRCRCPRCTVRALLGPAVIITIGVLFLLHEMRGSYFFDFSNTYPFILIVIGVVLLASSLAPMTGHVEPYATPQPPATPGAPQNPLPGQGQ